MSNRDKKIPHQPPRPPSGPTTVKVTGEVRTLEVPSERQLNQDKDSKKQYELNRWLLIVNFLTLVVVSFYAGLTLWQARSAAKSVQAAQDSIQLAKDQFAQDQRPYVAMSYDPKLAPNFSVVPATEIGLAGHIACTFHFKNYGKSPAVRLHTLSYISTTPRAEEDIHWKPINENVGVLLPPTSEVFNTAYSADANDQDAIASLYAKDLSGIKKLIIIHILFVYYDQASHRYTSEFCFGHNANGAIYTCPDHPDEIT